MDAANEIKTLKHIWILFSFGNADLINEINHSVYNPFGTRAKDTINLLDAFYAISL